MVKLLQEVMPSMTWIVKDNVKSLLSDCQLVSFPLKEKDILVMKKMID